MIGILSVVIIFIILMIIIYYPKIKQKSLGLKVFYFASFFICSAMLIFRSFDTEIFDPFMVLTKLFGNLIK